MNRVIFGAMLVAVAAGSFAQSRTMVTFADPSLDGSNKLFVFNTTTNILTGSYTGTGMTVQTPGVGGGSVANAKFTTSAIQLTQVPGSGIYTGGAGQVRFYTEDANQPFFVVDFTGATLFNPLNFGASQLNGSGVQFSGPNVPGGLTQQQFSFALANPTVNGNEISYTSSFTSSAVPEPATMTALALGAVSLLRRRKKV